PIAFPAIRTRGPPPAAGAWAAFFCCGRKAPRALCSSCAGGLSPLGAGASLGGAVLPPSSRGQAVGQRSRLGLCAPPTPLGRSGASRPAAYATSGRVAPGPPPVAAGPPPP